MFDIYRPSLRAAGAIAVLLAWLVSLGWLGLRRMHRTEETTISNEASLRLAPGSVWYAVYAGTTQIGNAGITLDTLSPGYRVGQTVVLETRNGDGLARATWLGKAWLGTAINVERLESRYSREGRQSEWQVTVIGDTVTAHFASAERLTQGRSVFSEPPTASVAIPYRLALGGGLAPGRTRSVRMLDGWPIGAGLSDVRVGRDSVIRFVDSSRATGGQRWVAAHTDSVRAYAVLFNGAGGPRRVWVDHRGAVSGVETPLGVRWVRTDFDLSVTDFRKTMPARTEAILSALPILTQFAASPPRDSATADRQFLVEHRDGSPVDAALLAMLAGGRQTVSGDTLTVHHAPVTLPGESIRDTTPDPMIQQDAFAITQAQQRMRIEPFDRDRLTGFLTAFRLLTRVDTAAAAAEDALGTLQAHVGRPDGVARLFVALLRASGVPSRYVIGVYPDSDTLRTHAWAEIWNAQSGGWYAVDPVSGSPVANTGLIRLALGGSSHPDEMLSLLANARLTEIGRKEQR